MYAGALKFSASGGVKWPTWLSGIKITVDVEFPTCFIQ
jgi:hypothetical protein